MYLLLIVVLAQIPDTPSAVISGRVVDAGSGRPIAGAVVTPAGSALPPPLPTDSAEPPHVLTNANGLFAIRGLRAGSLVLTATKGGYVNATRGQRRPAGSAQPLPIKDDDRLNDVEIRMWKQAAITGAITDEAGDPAIGTRVHAYQRSYVAGRPRFNSAGGGITDDRGVYRIAGLTPADYIVAVEFTQTSVPAEIMDAFFTGPPITDEKRRELSRELNDIGSAIAPSGSGYAMTVGGQTMTMPIGTLTPIAGGTADVKVYPTTFYPAAPSAAQAVVVPLKSGEEHGAVDIQVQAVRAARVSGTIAAGAAPVSTTAVRLVPAGNDPLVESIETAATVTDAAGGFTFPAVPPGDYVIRVLRLPRPPASADEGPQTIVSPSAGTVTISGGVRTSGAPPPPPPIPTDATLCAQVPLSVSGRDISDLVIPLTPAPRVSGRVEFEGTSDKPSSSSVVGIRILLNPADGSRLSDRTLTLQTGHPDENAEFTTYGVPPGQYVVSIAGAPAGWTLKGVAYQGRDLADTPVDLETKDITGVVITFTDRPSAIVGVVQGPRGPDPDAVVLAYPTDPDEWAASGGVPRRLRTARADATGAYSITGLPPGEYHVIAVKEDTIGDWQDPALLQALTQYAQQVRLVEGDRRNITLGAAEIR
jgi:protocatechuate 3,4-dioxygenase beta subunit